MGAGQATPASAWGESSPTWKSWYEAWEGIVEARAALFHSADSRSVIESIVLADPWPNEVLVRTYATGVCHSDLALRPDAARMPLMLLGHEGSGVVEAVGSAVTTVRPGDHVVTCPSGFCGACRQCLGGRPNLCTGTGIKARPDEAPQRLSFAGEAVRQFVGIGSFAEQMLLHENSIVKIDSDIPLEHAALLSCGVLTGMGAILRTSGLVAGETVAVFGCGGVGLSIIQGARIGGASQIIAVDVFESKLALARKMGATDVVNGGKVDAVEAIRDLTRGLGVDHALEAVGLPSLVGQAIACLAIHGAATIVGVLPGNATIEVPFASLRPECRLQTSRMGSTRFRIDVPRYLELYRQGSLLLEEMISRRGRLEDLDDAFVAMEAGEVARTMLMVGGR